MQTNKVSTNEAFKRPAPITEFTGELLSSPFMTNDDLVLYAQRPAPEKGKFDVVRSHRTKKGESLSKLEVVPIKSGSLNIGLGSVSNDEQLLFGYSRIPFDGKSKNSLVVLTRSKVSSGFEKPISIDLPDRPPYSTFPRYSQLNRELPFSGRSDTTRGARLWIVRDFEPLAAKP